MLKNLIKHCSAYGFRMIIKRDGDKFRKSQSYFLPTELMDVAWLAIREHLEEQENYEIEQQHKAQLRETLAQAFDSFQELNPETTQQTA